MNEHPGRDRSSQWEMVDDHGITRLDPERAHEAAGDTGFATRIPETCGLCQAKELAEAEAQAQELSEHG